jgi:hypothetical protein
MFPRVFKSITIDNGSEFADTGGIEGSVFKGETSARKPIIAIHIVAAREGATKSKTR